MMLWGERSDRRCIMAMTVQQIHPVAHLPLVLGVLRRLEVATVLDRLIPPHPAHRLLCGRGVEALVLAILDGHHALYKVGKRLEERGMLALLQPGLTRAALTDYRWGHILEALFAANLNKVYNAIALTALEVYAIATPWLHQDTTTIALYGAYEDEPQAPGAPRPAYGHSTDGRDDLKQGLLSLGVSGDGGDLCGSGCGMGIRVTVWRRRARLRSASPWAWRVSKGSWRIARRIESTDVRPVSGKGVRLGDPRATPLCGAPRTGSLGTAATRLAPLGELIASER